MSEPGLNPNLNPEHFGTVLDSVSDAVLTINRDFVVTSFNTAAEVLTGFHRTEAIGRLCHEVLRSSVCRHVADCPMTQLLGTGSTCLTRHCTIIDRHNREAPLMVSVRALRNGAGEVVGGVETFRATKSAYAPAAPNAMSATSPVMDSPTEAPPALPILEASERYVIEDVLRRNHWNRSAACEELGLSRTTLWRKMRRLGISGRRARRTKT